jgi:hypothetical protein
MRRIIWRAICIPEYQGIKVNKAAFVLGLLLILILSAIATMTPAFAIPTVTLSANTGEKGDQIQVTGTGAQPGGPVFVYWENTGGALLGQDFADGLGAYLVSINIPDAAAGVHYIIVKDISGTSAAAAFNVLPSISLNPTNGIPGTLVTVSGSGFSGNSTNQQRNVTIVFFNTTGTTVYSKEVGAVNASITGNFTVVIAVPAVANGFYFVNGSDHATGAPNIATTTFNVAGSAFVSPTSGPSGSIVTVTGNGLSHQTGLRVNISLSNSAISSTAVELTPILTLADGTFSGSIIVPTLPKSPYMVIAADPNFTVTTGTGINGFMVTGTTGITVSRNHGVGGDMVTLTGQNFTAISGTAVTVRFGQTAAGTLRIATFTTTASGAFVGTITVPNLPTSPPIYYINATDANGLNQTTTFLIASISVFLSPTTGPTGSLVTATVFELGMTGAITFNLTFGNVLVVASAPVTSGASAVPFFIPTVPVGTYNVVITEDTGFQGTTTFTVTATSILSVSPSAGLAGMPGVALTLTNFGANASPHFYLNNATSSYPLAVGPTAPFVVLTANASGTFLGTFTVPSLAPGSYIMVANDTSGFFTATAPFAVTQNAPIIPEFQPLALMTFFILLSAVVMVVIHSQKKQKAPVRNLNLIALHAPYLLFNHFLVSPIVATIHEKHKVTKLGNKGVPALFALIHPAGNLKTL